jgi:hypothetical protein
MATPIRRPSRVVIVDADNPMVEVKGEFFWREDHDAIIATERQRAYQAGYNAGWTSAITRSQGSRLFVLRRRRTTLRRVRRLVVGIVLLAMLTVVFAVIAGQLVAQR